MTTPRDDLSLIAVLIVALVHVVAGVLHGGVLKRPTWMSVASGLSVAYVFVHLLPDLADKQATYLEQMPGRRLMWLETQIYLAALLGLLVALALNRAAAKRSGRRVVSWLHIGSFAVYNLIVGGSALRVGSVTEMILGVLAFGSHFLVNDHTLHLQYGKVYVRYGRWVLAAAIVFGWVLAVTVRPPAVVDAVLLGLVSGSMITNILRDEVPQGREGRFSAFVAGAVGYSILLLALGYVTRTA